MGVKQTRTVTGAEFALIRLKFLGLELTKENLHVTLDFKPASISENRWWAMLNSVRKEDLG